MEKFRFDFGILREEIKKYCQETRDRPARKRPEPRHHTKRRSVITANIKRNDDWLDGIKEITAYTGFSSWCLDRYRRHGFPAWKIEGRLISSKKQIDKWMSGALPKKLSVGEIRNRLKKLNRIKRVYKKKKSPAKS